MKLSEVVNEIIKDYQYWMAEAYYWDAENFNKFKETVAWMRIRMMDIINIQICKYKGHQWCEEDVDPENGSSLLCCKRCGENQNIWW